MVRIKYVEPRVAQTQSATPRTLGANTPKSAQKEQQDQKRTIETPLISKQSQAVRQKQSQELVQIMLHVSFGTLFYLREFLPLQCFEDRDLRRLAQKENSLSYRKFINGKTSMMEYDEQRERGFGQGKRGQPLKILVRNRDAKADELLDLLEGGIFDALDKNFLEAIQLTVIVDEAHPENVLESYTFTFKYTGANGAADRRLASVSLASTDCVADMKTTQAARLGLEMIIRRMITLSTFLPVLPNKRSLGIHLFYTEDCPRDYEPAGFTTAADERIRFPCNEDWQKQTQSCGAMDSGYHTVGLKVTSLKWTGPEQDSSENIAQVPSDLQYTDSISRTKEIGVSSNDAMQIETEQNSSQESTQARHDAEEKQRLQKMMLMTSSIPDGELIPTQQLEHSSNLNLWDEDSPDVLEDLQLSETKVSQIRQHISSLALDNRGNNGNGAAKVIRCQCSWNGEEPGMIKCSFCHTYQHSLCYGFINPTDPRLPETHACYRCLLEPNEPSLIPELNTLVLLRRAMKIIMEDGYPHRISVFSQKLHCNGQTVVQVENLLKKQGFIRPTPGNKSRGFLATGLPKYTIPQSPENKVRMRREIFNPVAKIEHLYIRNSTRAPTSLKDKALSSQGSMSFTSKENGLQPQSRSLGGKGKESKGYQSSDDELTDVIDRSQSPKRKLPEREASALYEPYPSSQILIPTSMPAYLSVNENTTRTQDQEMLPTPGVLKRRSTDSTTAETNMNRPEKRRKMSAAAKHVDVGVMSTDEDSS
ncbi:meiosis specific protein Hop1, putative [Paecilomyces variotii No. 5]|uniref:Meiosis specific protein Hop1, putative n=1 Tax=Byssochlamys spectabilis (strain No. 5 / NBRC 109023) TaxID=1356009 RepID=V5F9S4_BYSSN|nr:meiosis specific protein Hop1, putative [Paecilomyces variotii No. 5]